MGAATQASYPALLAASPSIGDQVAARIGDWQAATSAALETAWPLAPHAQSWRQWQAAFASARLSQDALHRAVDDYTAFCQLIGQPSSEAFWRSQFGRADRAISTRLLLEQWQKQLDQERADWELRELAARRAALLAEFDEWLGMLQTLHRQLALLGLDAGILLDLSAGRLTAQDIAQLKRWVSYLAEDEGIQALCALLGRMQQIAWSDRIARIASMTHVATPVPDINSREEIIGIRMGRDLERLLPSELALLADPDTALLFDLKYVESSLMCFDMQGMQAVARHVQTEQERRVQEAEQQGPMVICVDTSGSMQGMPETIAKAVTLYFAARAREQKRPCYLINFSTNIVTLDLSGDVGLEAVLGFLQMSFHGGTDVAPALGHALDTMEQDNYRNADLLMISDFIMASLPEESQARIDRHRLEGNKFHSLVVGECFMRHRLRNLFDNEWVVDPRDGQIHDLIDFARKVGQTTPIRTPRTAAAL